MQREKIILSHDEKERYDRQMILPDWGEKGQERIKCSSVFLAGAGGLGSAAAIYLAAAGVGNIRICDADEVELSNLNRQILHTDADIGRKKIQSAVQSISKINLHVQISSLNERIERRNISHLVGEANIIVDCLDNFETRYIVNEYAVQKKLPFIHAGVYGMAGQITFIQSPQTPCLRCIFPDAPSPQKFPVVGAAPGVMGCLEALEALKFITGIPVLLKNRLLVWEGDVAKFEEIRLERDPSCPVCSKR
jgi:adenylyltransferase/sulfurtransferase